MEQSETGPARNVVAGLLLILPAAIALLVSYAGPTLWTVRASLDGGADAYRRVAGDAFAAIGFGFSLAVLPVLSVVVLAPLLAYAAHHAGKQVRWAVRAVLAVPMVLFAPAVFATGWLLDRVTAESVREPGSAQSVLRLAVWLTTIGLACGVAVTLYLAALRSRDPGQTAGPALLVVGGLVAIATVAAVLQVLAYPAALTDDKVITPLLEIYLAEPADGAAAATLLGIVLGLLGIFAASLVILSGLRVEVGPAAADDEVRRGPAVAAFALLAAVLAGAGYGLWPGLSRLVGFGEAELAAPDMAVLGDTWLPPLLSTVVGVGLAAAAGYGIAVLRPLGRHSELLLLPFAPWLFVGEGPLAVAYDDRVRAEGAGLVPPLWIVVPAVFVFAVLFRGSGRGSLRAAWPVAVLVVGATWLVRAQGVGWAGHVASYSADFTGPVAILNDPEDAGARAAALPLGVVVLFAVALAALQVRYLDRVAILTATALTATADPGRGRRALRPKRVYPDLTRQ